MNYSRKTWKIRYCISQESEQRLSNYIEPYTDKVYIFRLNFGLGFTEQIEVDPATVGQYTGLKDEIGKKIFDGDVIKWVPGIRTITGIVEFDEGGYCANKYFLHAVLRNGQFDGIVVGNIYDKEAPNGNQTD